MPSLLVKDGPLAGRRVEVESPLVLGRIDADLTLDDPLISRRHAEVRPVDGALEIEDLGSLNGTWVNDERIAAPTRLASGDVIRIGAVSLVVEVERTRTGHETILAPLGETPFPPATPTPAELEPAGDEAAREPAAVPARAPESAEVVRPVTALAVDVLGIPMLRDAVGGPEADTVLRESVDRVRRAVERFGGVTQHPAAESVTALFGAERAHEDDPERAARAALAAVAALREYGRDVEEAWGVAEVAGRAAIQTREARVPVGTSARPASVLGEAGEGVAALRQSAEPGSVVVDEATARSLVRRFALEPAEGVELGDGAEPVPAWKLARAPTRRAVAETPLVGRDTELARLDAVLDAVVAGRGQTFFVVGDAGIGKTRLLDEFRTLAAERAVWLEGLCFSYATGTVYEPFIQVLRGWAGIAEGEPALAARSKLQTQLALLGAPELEEARPYLARLLSLKLEPADEEVVGAHSAAELGERIRTAYRTWIAALARRDPVVLAIDDLHWVDPASRALAQELVQLCLQIRLLLVVALRLDVESEGSMFRAEVAVEPGHRTGELRLEPLDEAASRALARALPRSGEVPESALEIAVLRAEGNPLYLEELVTVFAERAGAPEQPLQRPAMTGARELTPTLRSILLSRIDELPESARRLAQLAALIGRTFPRAVLESLVEGETIDRDLRTLLEAKVIHELRGQPEPEYAFRHGLLREAAASMLPPAERTGAYAAVGRAFETVFASSLDDHLEAIAHYYGRSDDVGRAVHYLERAGERAALLGATRQGQDLWRRALALAEERGDPATAARLRNLTRGEPSAAEPSAGEPTVPP
ncbi:MAG: AAA family ATPase [Thermoleophilia bacterium]|nr:AAA family ATPase [Thermoleophilia bacterium]